MVFFNEEYIMTSFDFTDKKSFNWLIDVICAHPLFKEFTRCENCTNSLCIRKTETSGHLWLIKGGYPDKNKYNIWSISDYRIVGIEIKNEDQIEAKLISEFLKLNEIMHFQVDVLSYIAAIHPARIDHEP